jgi:hypothetical protein
MEAAELFHDGLRIMSGLARSLTPTLNLEMARIEQPDAAPITSH